MNKTPIKELIKRYKTTLELLQKQSLVPSQAYLNGKIYVLEHVIMDLEIVLEVY